MPRHAQGPRLYLRQRKGREPIWVIRDGPDEESTGCGKDDVEGAAHALQEYLTKRFTPNTGQRDLAQISIPEVLTMYAQGFAVNHAAPELVGYHMGPLLDFWGEKSLADVKGATCRSYVEWRTRQVGRHKKPVSAGTARRELETLQAAINRWHKESPLTAVPSITLPPKAHRRERFLERWEAARLLASALGYRPAALDIHTREPILWRRLASRQMRIARFILSGLDTGTRHSAILGLQWLSSIKGGHADLDRGLLYRRGARERDTAKRRPPVAISASLRSHMRRWFRSDSAKGIASIVHWHGKPIKKERRAWAECVEGASLGPDITPHVLRHTCATWALWNGKSIWEVAERLGTSAAMIDRVYGHHRNATISGAKLGPGKNAANLSH